MLYLECPKHTAIVCYPQPCQKFCLHVSEESRQIWSKASPCTHLRGKGWSFTRTWTQEETHRQTRLAYITNLSIYEGTIMLQYIKLYSCKVSFFCWGEFNNKQVEWLDFSSKLYHHVKGKVKLQKSSCVAILFPISLFFDMKSMKTNLFTHFWSDQSHIAG